VQVGVEVAFERVLDVLEAVMPFAGVAHAPARSVGSAAQRRILIDVDDLPDLLVPETDRDGHVDFPERHLFDGNRLGVFQSEFH
jgi:hypothetical protein